MATSVVLVGITLMFVELLRILGLSPLAVPPMILPLGAIGCFLIAMVLLLEPVAAAWNRLGEELSRREEPLLSSSTWG